MLYTLVKSSPLKCKFLRIFSAQVKIREITHVSFKLTSQLHHSSFFRTLNSHVNLKFMHFLLWMKGSDQSPKFKAFECSVENLSNSSCHFWKHKSVFLQFLHQHWMPSDITPLHFLAGTLILWSKAAQYSVHFWDFWVIESKFIKFLMSILNRKVFFLNFAPFFSVTAHNLPVSFKLIHFLLWVKGFHQSLKFGTFECSGENLPNFSCHFPNHKSVFLQIFHHSPVSWKITPPYFFSSNIIYFRVIESKFAKFLTSILKRQVNFS